MADPRWQLLIDKQKIPAKAQTGLWTLVLETVQGLGRLKLEATGEWTYDPGLKRTCGPDGDFRSDYDASHCLLPKAAPGSLVGKIGGSTAGVEDGFVFVVGSFCVVEPGIQERGNIAEKIPANGPLYLGINDRRDAMFDNAGDLTVSVFAPMLGSPVT